MNMHSVKSIFGLSILKALKIEEKKGKKKKGNNRVCVLCRQ